eukprot:COSAG05_NODE_107_length_18696_cov_209.227766_6_plen_246_part_00
MRDSSANQAPTHTAVSDSLLFESCLLTIYYRRLRYPALRSPNDGSRIVRVCVCVWLGVLQLMTMTDGADIKHVTPYAATVTALSSPVTAFTLEKRAARRLCEKPTVQEGLKALQAQQAGFIESRAQAAASSRMAHAMGHATALTAQPGLHFIVGNGSIRVAPPSSKPQQHGFHHRSRPMKVVAAGGAMSSSPRAQRFKQEVAIQSPPPDFRSSEYNPRDDPLEQEEQRLGRCVFCGPPDDSLFLG